MTNLASAGIGDRAPRLLLLLGQSPFDPTSGAAQSTRLIAEVLAGQGFAVRSLATTACEGSLPADHQVVLSELDAALRPVLTNGVYRFVSGSVHHALVAVDPDWKHDWERRVGTIYEAEYSRLLAEWKPDILLTYGGDSTDIVRRRRARRAGAVVVFALHNLYYRKHPPKEVDTFLAPTRFVADAYANCLSAPIKVLPPPLDPRRVLADSSEPAAICFINPEPAKGALLVAQLADRLSRERSDLILLVVGGRAPADALAVVGRDLGLDLTQYSNLVQVPPTGRVSEVWGASRVVLMPSVVQEAAGRCALEAMLNGVIPLVSDQGGLAEIVGAAGRRLPPPPKLTGRPEPVPAGIIDAWWEALMECCDDLTNSRRVATACRAHAANFTIEAVAPGYTEWFRVQLKQHVE